MNSDSEDEMLLHSSSESEFSLDSESDTDDDCSFSVVRDWCKLDEENLPPAPPRFPFMGCPGIKCAVDDLSDPLTFFYLFLDDAVTIHIVEETNRYASLFLDKNNITPGSRAQKWTETDVKEIRVFLSLLLLQGIIHKPKEKWFWSTRPVLNTPFVSKVMSEKRYGLIMKFLHFSNDETFNKDLHPQPKLKKVFEMINDKFRRIYLPERDISIDESLMPYKGRLGWKQFIPSKRARFGIKLFHLCESESGYIWNTIIYTGKDTLFDKRYESYGLSTKSVMSLIHDLLDKGYCLTVDNFYSSPELAEMLISRRTDVFGTLRATRKNLPSSIKSEKLKKGDVIAFQKGKMMALKWQDKKPVCILSTIHAADMQNCEKNGKISKKPVAVCHYNETMGGVDKADQCLSYYPSIRNQQRRYYKKIFRHLLNQAVWNSFVLYSKCGGKLMHLDFRVLLIERLIEENCKVSERSLAPMNSRNIFRLTGRHFPSLVPQSGRKANPSRRCVICCLKVNENGKRIRRETRYQCEDCNVGLCVVPCFKDYHTRQEL